MEFNKKMNTSDGYFQIAIIPKGSRQIFIEEIHPTKNFLSIGKTGTNQTFLNGHRLIFMPGEFKVGYLTGLYERENEQEKITIPGPVPFDLTLEVSVITRPLDYIQSQTKHSSGFGSREKQKSRY